MSADHTMTVFSGRVMPSSISNGDDPEVGIDLSGDPFGPIKFLVRSTDEATVKFINDLMAKRAVNHRHFAELIHAPDDEFELSSDIGAFAMIGPMSDDTIRGLSSIISRSIYWKSLLIEFADCTHSGAVTPMRDNLVDLDLLIGHHLVVSLSELIERVVRRTVKVTYPYFAPVYLMEQEDRIEALLDKYVDEPSLASFDIPSFVHIMYPRLFTKYEIFQHVPLRSVEVFRPSFAIWDFARLVLDTDAVNDMLDRDGWTPEHIKFARAQLAVKLSSKFSDFLKTRADCPIAIDA